MPDQILMECAYNAAFAVSEISTEQHSFEWTILHVYGQMHTMYPRENKSCVYTFHKTLSPPPPHIHLIFIIIPDAIRASLY